MPKTSSHSDKDVTSMAGVNINGVMFLPSGISGRGQLNASLEWH